MIVNSNSIMESSQETPSSPIPTAKLSGSNGSIKIVGNQEQEEKMKMENEKREKVQMMMLERGKKLALWNTSNFTPILSHDQLQPIMATLGFFPLPGLISISSAPPTPANPNPNSNTSSDSVPVSWREYYYYSSATPLHQQNSESGVDPSLPRPRLPYPNIVGLHLLTYRAFFKAICFYLPPFSKHSDTFHLRGMPLQGEDRNKLWHDMNEDDYKYFVHCEASFDSSAHDQNEIKICAESDSGNVTPFGVFAPLDDIITKPPTQSKKMGKQKSTAITSPPPPND